MVSRLNVIKVIPNFNSKYMWNHLHGGCLYYKLVLCFTVVPITECTMVMCMDIYIFLWMQHTIYTETPAVYNENVWAFLITI